MSESGKKNSCVSEGSDAIVSSNSDKDTGLRGDMTSLGFLDEVSKIASTEPNDFLVTKAGLSGTGGFGRDGDDPLRSKDASLPFGLRPPKRVRHKLESTGFSVDPS